MNKFQRSVLAYTFVFRVRVIGFLYGLNFYKHITKRIAFILDVLRE